MQMAELALPTESVRSWVPPTDPTIRLHLHLLRFSSIKDLADGHFRYWLHDIETIKHELRHVLGLNHEHQRSNSWLRHTKEKPSVLAAMHSIHCDNKHPGEDTGFEIKISDITHEGFSWKIVHCHLECIRYFGFI